MRAIDAEHLTKWILSWWEQTSPTSEYLKGADILAQIDREPTIEAVSVVRCKECKYWKESQYYQEIMVCTYVMGATFTRQQDDFCSRGERKESE